MNTQEIKKLLEKYKSNLYEIDKHGFQDCADLLLPLVEALEFYASALNLPEESSLGEPNIDPYLFPARLGTRAKQALEAYEAWKRGESE